MELVHVAMSSVDLVDQVDPVRVPHASAELERALGVDEEVVVCDLDGEFHGARVFGIDLEDGALVYLIHLGVRLPPTLVAQRLADVHQTPENKDVNDIVDLLGDLRRAGFKPEE